VKGLELDPIERANLVLSAGAVTASLALAPPMFTASLGAGALLGAMNFRALRSAAQRMFDGSLPGAGPWMGLYGLRFAVLAVALAFAFDAGAHPTALTLGISLVVPASVIGAWRMRPPIDPDAPALDADDPSWERWNPWLAREREHVPGEEDER
jgi:hypothetical protein